MQMQDECTRIRRDLHKMPEPGFKETKTCAYLYGALKQCNPDKLEIIAQTGVKAVYYAKETQKNVETIAFRADMDALTMLEETDTEYKSGHPGKMHGCGHDGHMAMLLTTAKLIDKHRNNLKKNVVLLFQPAEEGKGGARRMIADGALRDPDVDRIYGFHLWPDVPKGKLAVRWGPMMAQTCEFDVKVRGVSAHGATPQKGVDAIVSTAAFITLLQSTITRSLDPQQEALLTIGKIKGGTARNVLADEVVLNGTLRVMSQEVFEDLMAHLRTMAEGLALATGARYEIKELMHYPCVDNPREMVEDFYKYIDMKDMLIADPVMAAEDFSYYQQEIPGVFIFIGIGGGKNNSPLHSPCFDFDEDAMLHGVEVYVRLLELFNAARY